MISAYQNGVWYGQQANSCGPLQECQQCLRVRCIAVHYIVELWHDTGEIAQHGVDGQPRLPGLQPLGTGHKLLRGGALGHWFDAQTDELGEQLALPDDGVDEVRVALVLVLQHVVEQFELVEQVAVVALLGQHKAGSRGEFEQLDELVGRDRGEALQVGRDIGQHGQDAVPQCLESLVAVHDQLEQHQHQQIGVRAREAREIELRFVGGRQGLVQ